MQPLQITASSVVSALGVGKAAHLAAIKTNTSGLTRKVFLDTDTVTPASYLGEVSSCDDVALPEALSLFDCRNHRLAYQALLTDDFIATVNVATEKYGEDEIGIAVGTSTSGIAQTEAALRQGTDLSYGTTHRMTSLGDFCAQALNIKGPRQVVSTACSSSAKVFATAQRWLEAGIAKAVVVGGVDSLCATTYYGFHSLGLVSESLCTPLDSNRSGINIGEAGGFMLLEAAQTISASSAYVTGVGEATDGYHAATPHPEGVGAKLAMQRALGSAKLEPDQIDYLNLHGTGTPANDLSEMKAVSAIWQGQRKSLQLSSTKAFTGHTLAAAGIVEAVLCELAIHNNYAPGNLNLNSLDNQLAVPDSVDIYPESKPQTINVCMSNSLGFGGSNASLILQSGQSIQEGV